MKVGSYPEPFSESKTRAAISSDLKSGNLNFAQRPLTELEIEVLP